MRMFQHGRSEIYSEPATRFALRVWRLAHCDVDFGVCECFHCCSGGYLDGWEVREGEEEWGKDVGGEGEGGGGGECLKERFCFVFVLFCIA